MKPNAWNPRFLSILATLVGNGVLFISMINNNVCADDWGLEQYYQPNLCGPIALCCICRSYGIDATIDELVRLSDFDGKTTSIYGLVQASSTKKLHAVAQKSSSRHLHTITGPAIVDFPRSHFSVFAGWHKGKVLICDPPNTVQSVDLQEFLKEWGGHLITFSRLER